MDRSKIYSLQAYPRTWKVRTKLRTGRWLVAFAVWSVALYFAASSCGPELCGARTLLSLR